MRIVSIALPGIVLAFSGVAFGQEHPDGFYLTSPLGVSSGYDKGFIVGSQPVNDDVTILTAPTFAWFTSSHRTQFSFDYAPEFEFFARRPGLDAWNHASTLRLTHRINSRFTLEAGNSFLSTMDSSRALENSLVLLPWGRFDQNAFYADLVYRVNTTTKITARFDNAFTLVALPQVEGRLDNDANAGTVTLDKVFSSHHQISASYSFLRVTPLSPQTAGTPSNVNVGVLGYIYTVNPNLLVRLTAGDVQGPESGYNGAAAIEKKLGEMWFAAGYQRYIGFFGTPGAPGPTTEEIPFAAGVTPSSIYHVISLRATGRISKRVGLRVVAQRALNGTDTEGRGIRSTIGQFRLDYKLSDRVVAFVRADHYGQNINRFFDFPLSRDVYLGGLEIVLSRPPETNRSHGKAPQDSTDNPPVDNSATKEEN